MRDRQDRFKDSRTGGRQTERHTEGQTARDKERQRDIQKQRETDRRTHGRLTEGVFGGNRTGSGGRRGLLFNHAKY